MPRKVKLFQKWWGGEGDGRKVQGQEDMDKPMADSC